MEIKEINDIIQKIAEEKTFSLESLERIKQLKDDYEIVKNDFLITEEKYEDSLEKLKILEGVKTEYQTRLSELSEREKVVAEKEAKQALDDQALEFQRKRADEIKEMFSIVFKNPVVRENAYKSISGNNCSNESNSITKEVE